MLGERAGEECAGDRERQTDRQKDRQTDRFWPRAAAFFLIFLSGQKATLGTGKG